MIQRLKWSPIIIRYSYFQTSQKVVQSKSFRQVDSAVHFQNDKTVAMQPAIGITKAIATYTVHISIWLHLALLQLCK